MTDNVNIKIGKKLEAHLSDIKMSPIELAENLGVSSQYVYNVLKGKPLGKKSAEKWGKVLGVKPNWLLTGDGPMTNDEMEEYFTHPEIYTDAQLDEIVENRLSHRILELINSGLYVSKEEHERAINKENRLLNLIESQQRTIENLSQKGGVADAGSVASKTARG